MATRGDVATVLVTAAVLGFGFYSVFASLSMPPPAIQPQNFTRLDSGCLSATLNSMAFRNATETVRNVRVLVC